MATLTYLNCMQSIFMPSNGVSNASTHVILQRFLVKLLFLYNTEKPWQTFKSAAKARKELPVRHGAALNIILKSQTFSPSHEM